MQWLPLFPLQVVLLPGGELPLHIFEERYKEMIADVIRGGAEFGVVLASEQGIVNTGCTATIDRVIREYPDGRLDILTVGRRRFEITRLNDDRSYLRAEVEFFDDEEHDDAAEDARRRAIEGYNELRKLSSEAPLAPSDVHRPQLSFRLAQVVQDLNFRQAMLTARSEADRIKQLAEFLPRFLIRQRRVEHVKQVAPRNGHGGKISQIQ
jgi:Lon protease-like protein